jgi:signal transduction histidine kinase
VSEVAGWLRRVRGSVRLRVTLLAAGAFALTLLVAAMLLLRALEGALVDDVRVAARRALAEQAERLTAEGIPSNAVMVSIGDVPAARFPGVGGQNFLIALPEGADPNEYFSTNVQSAVAGAPVMLDSQTIASELGLGSTSAGFVASSRPVGGALLSTVSPLDEVRATIDRTRELLWIVGPALVALVAGLSWLLASRALRPVRQMTARVAAIESRSLHERVPEPRSRDEIAELARTMNQMLGRLEHSNDTSRRLVSDASHELRTPVAVMRTELEVAVRDPHTDWSATSDVLLDELDRLQLLVDDLLLLARGDERALAHDEVDLGEVVETATARRRRVPVELVVAEPVVVSGDVRGLERALDHLIGNATRAANDRVVVTVEGDTSEVAVHVDDDGPGIPAGQRSSVVRRFVRLDEARSRDQGGAGLGLAVANDVATGHGGRLEIGDSPLGGARVSLYIPTNGTVQPGTSEANSGRTDTAAAQIDK